MPIAPAKRSRPAAPGAPDRFARGRGLSQARIADIPGPAEFVRFAPGFGPRFLVTVDT